MSRPTHQKLVESLGAIEAALRNERVTLPFEVATDIGGDLRYANRAAEDVAKFIDLAHRAFAALEGLLANWPTTDAAGKYLTEVNRPVMMRDKALDEAGKALAEYREVEGDFMW